ncbi:MAG TPA: ATP-binding cassette domain-containing protein [bacterium]|nr:ATP-binding cassette domain-containing protein [bacterium]
MDNIIKVRNLRVSLNGTEVLKGINLDVVKGESLVIVGSSGCGKSVLLKTILNLIGKDDGQIYLFGEDTGKMDEKKVMETRSRIGMVFQNSALLDSLSVWENVGFYYLYHTDYSEEKIKGMAVDILRDVGMEGVENLLPEHLSGGMKKRVSVARALISKPEILFYDEPTTGLDPITSESITGLIRSIHARFKTTDITVTHDVKLASRISDRIALIDGGVIEDLGSFEELKMTSRNPIVRSFIDMGAENDKKQIFN